MTKPISPFLPRLCLRSANRVHLKLTDSIPTNCIDINKASRMPTQDEDQEDLKPDVKGPHQVTPCSQLYLRSKLRQFQHRSLDVMEKPMINTDADEHQSTNNSHTTKRHFIWPKLLNLVCCEELTPSDSFEPVYPARGVYGDTYSNQGHQYQIQRMIHINREDKLFLNRVNFESRFFQKLFRNRWQMKLLNPSSREEFRPHKWCHLWTDISAN